MSRSSPTGSITATERMWAPTSEPFSTTTTEMSDESCFSRMAAANPAGPAPTITTSNSIASRAGSSCVFIRTSLSANLHTAALQTYLPFRCTPTRPCRRAHLSARPLGYAITYFCGPQRWHRLPTAAAMSSHHRKAVRELLAFYQETGVEALVGDAPV